MTVSKRARKTLTAVLTALAVLLAGAGVAYAVNDNSLTQGYTNHTIYKFGRDVTITGTVNGDIFCGGQTVTIDADVNGDVICAGQTVTVHGLVHGNVRVAGQTVTVNAKVDNNASMAGQDITLPENAVIGRDVSAAGQTIYVNGTVGRDLDAAANTVTISAPVGRNATVHASDKLVLHNGARIDRLDYTSPRTYQKDSGAQVADVYYHKEETHKENKTGWAVLWRLYWLVAMAVLAVILVALFPGLFRRWNEVGDKRLGWAILTGFVAMIVAPIFILLIFLTVIGIPLGILLLVLWIAAAILSAPLAMYYLGSRIVPGWHPVLAVLLGAVIIGLLQMIPFVGGLVMLVAYWLGTGILLLNLRSIYQRPVYITNKTAR